MSDLDLLLFGCVVSFIAVAGFYVYLRQAFESHREEGRSVGDARPDSLRDVA